MKRLLGILILIALLSYGLYRFFSKPESGQFEAVLIRVDTARVHRIYVDPRGREDPFTLMREGDGWILTDGTLSVRAMPGPVRTLLENIQLITSRDIVSTASGSWKTFGVDEAQGTRIQVLERSGDREDFRLGRFQQDPETRSGFAYLRLTGEEEVYLVDGLQTLPFHRTFDAYRNHQFLSLPPDVQINQILYQLPDTTWTLQRTDKQWIGPGNQLVELVAVDKYLKGLRDLSGSWFADDFDKWRADTNHYRRLILRDTVRSREIHLELYRDSTRKRPFLMGCSQQPDTFFASDSTGLFQTVFHSMEAFLPRDESR